MTKKEMAEEILQNSSLMSVSEYRFYKNVNKQPKGFIKMLYDDVMSAGSDETKKSRADHATVYFI